MLGCGDIGRILLEKEPSLTVVDKKGDVLHKMGYHAVTGDPADPDTLKKAGVEKAEAILILEKHSEGLQVVRELNPEALVLLVEQPGKREDMYRKADVVIPTSQCVADECLHLIGEHKKVKRKEKLEAVLRSGGPMAIIMHDNPDPDCVSSALSLKLIAEKTGVSADVYYGGQIGYSENQVLVELLGLDLILPEGRPDFSHYHLTAFVDHSPWDYTSIARDLNPDIVVDHHIQTEYEGRFVDVREDVGSTSTIMIEYLQLFGVDIDAKLATGLFYGLLVDTHSFRRGLSPEDLDALAALKGKMDIEMLSRVEKAGFSRGLRRGRTDAAFLDVLGEAVKNVQVQKGVAFSNVGKVKYRDSVSNSADYLLKMEKVDVVVVYGTIKDSVYISARSWNEQLHVGKLLREAFKDLGRAGGHPLMGGAVIPLEKLSEPFEKEIVERILTAKSHHS